MSLLRGLGLAAVVVGWGLTSTALAQRGPAVVEITQIKACEVTPTLATLGTIMPTRRAVIGSAVDGRVVEFLVREGDHVKKDEALARLLTATIELELEAAEAELKLREQEQTELKNGSQALEIEQAKARLEACRVAAEFLDRDTRRLSQLRVNSAISASEVEDSNSRWLAAQQRFIEAQAAYQLAVDGPRPEKLAQAESRVEMQKAITEKLKDQIAKHTLYSRFDGYVTVEHTEEGQWLPRGEPVAEIIALDEVDVLAKVLEAHIPFIHVGDKATVKVPALVGRKSIFFGTVAAIIPEADEGSRTFPVKVRVTNEFNATTGEPELKAGMLARVELPTSDPQNVLMVPKDALVLKGEKKLIWIIDAASIKPATAASDMLEANALAIPVTPGVEQDDWIAVSSDVKDGTGDPAIKAGAAVAVLGNERIPQAPPGAPPSRVTWSGK